MAIRKRQHRESGIVSEFGRAAVKIFAANERINQLLIERLDPAA